MAWPQRYCTAVVLGGAWAYLARQRHEREELFNQALARRTASMHRRNMLATTWLVGSVARDATHALERLLPDAPEQSTRAVAKLVREVTQAARSAENDQKLLAELVDIRSAKADDPTAW